MSITKTEKLMDAEEFIEKHPEILNRLSKIAKEGKIQPERNGDLVEDILQKGDILAAQGRNQTNERGQKTTVLP